VSISDEHSALRISRRRFLSTGVVTAGIPVLSMSTALPAASKADPRVRFGASTDLLCCTREAAQWIQSVERQDARGAYWLPEPDHPDKLSTVSAPNTIYSGSAGVVLFFIELARGTGDTGYLGCAVRGADFLASTWRDLIAGNDEKAAHEPGLSLSIYSGLAGLAFVLIEAAKHSGDEKYRDAAKLVSDYIVQAAKAAGVGIAWSGSPGIAADGGTILYLLHAAQEFKSDRYRATAVQAGDHLLEIATHEPHGGVSWRGNPASAGYPNEDYYPNFESGTAGVAYVLARLYRATRDARYLNAAEQGAAHLQNIATVHGDAALIPYRLPDLADLYYLGFCHGPAGTARTFFELHDLTRNPAYLLWTERLAQGVVQSGIPEQLTPGLWNVACQCCGSAAIVELFVGLWASTGRKDYLAFAQRVARQLISRGTNLDGQGLRWYQAWTRVKPWEVNSETGYSIGAAGIGASLLHVHLAEQGKYQAILLPDNPFPASRQG
jgi:lantibiotic modifying enzyme